jgi:hypothetical protein
MGRNRGFGHQNIQYTVRFTAVNQLLRSGLSEGLALMLRILQNPTKF